MSYPIHAALVSEHPVPTLAPLLDPMHAVSEVILIHGAERREQAEHQARVLRKHGKSVRIEGVRDAYDLAALRLDIALILPEATPLAINITGGSKLMSLAAFEIATQHNHAAYYIHRPNNEVTWLNRDHPPQAIPDNLGVSDHLEALGYKTRRAETQDYSAKARQLVNRFVFSPDDEALSSLIRYTAQMSVEGTTTSLPAHDRHKVNSLVKKLAEAGIAAWSKQDPNQLKLIHPQARMYLHGVWLELYVENTLRSIQDEYDLHDISAGLIVSKTLKNDPNPTSNELDLALVHNKALHIIECKSSTKSLDTAIYKLDVLREMLGGIRGKAILITLQEPGEGLQKRAEDRGHTLFGGKNALKDLKTHLIHWLTTH